MADEHIVPTRVGVNSPLACGTKGLGNRQTLRLLNGINIDRRPFSRMVTIQAKSRAGAAKAVPVAICRESIQAVRSKGPTSQSQT